MKKILSLLLVMIMVVASFAACGKKADPTTPTTPTTPTEPSEPTDPTPEIPVWEQEDSADNTFTVGDADVSGTFNPLYLSSTYDNWIARLVFEALVARNTDGENIPGIADWEVSEDLKTITFTLIDGITFSDGTPLTTEDVKFTYELYAHPDYDGGNGGFIQDIIGADEFTAGTADSISGIEVIDEKTIAITVKEGLRTVVDTINITVMPKHYYAPDGTIDFAYVKSLNEKPLGSGPYKLVEYVPTQYVRLTRTETWDRGGYSIKNIIYKYVTGAVELDSLLAGEIDLLAGSITPDTVNEAKAEGFNAIQYPRSGYGFIKYNTAAPITNDVKVRQALTYGFDKLTFVESYFEGLAVTQPTPMSQVSWAYTEELKSKLNNYDFSLEKAGQLLDEAGWTLGTDGFRYKDGQRLVLNFPATSENAVIDAFLPLIKENYADLGIELNATFLDFNSLLDKVYSDDLTWHIHFMATTISTPDPDPLYFSYHSKFIGGDKDNNTKINDPLNDELLERSRTVIDIDEARQVFGDWAINFNELMPINVVYANVYSDLLNPRVENYTVTSLYDWVRAMKDATIKPAQ